MQLKLPYHLEIPLLVIMQKQTNENLKRNTVNSSILYNNQDMETTQMPTTDKCINKMGYIYICSSVQSLSRVRLLVTPWTAACQASLSITKSQSLLKLMSIKSVMPSSHRILCCPFLFLQLQGLFQWVKWTKYWFNSHSKILDSIHKNFYIPLWIEKSMIS